MKSFTWRELEAINRCLNTIGESIRGKQVTWYTDSRKSYLYEIAVTIFEKLQNLQIIFDIQWLPREENIQADLLSRCFDSDDWGIKNSVFSNY